jgi:predicted transcriptional regulator
MDVPLTPEQEAELKAIASREGRNADSLAREVLSIYLKREAQFVAAVKRGMASAERGDFVEHDEVLARIERLLHS